MGNRTTTGAMRMLRLAHSRTGDFAIARDVGALWLNFYLVSLGKSRAIIKRNTPARPRDVQAINERGASLSRAGEYSASTPTSSVPIAPRELHRQ